MIEGSGYVGSGSEASYDMGCAAGICAIAALAGHEIPELLMTPTVVVNRDNLERAWKLTYNEDLPENLQKALDASK